MNATWGTTRTGMTYHSFNADGTAICRKNIRQPEGVDSYTEAQVDARLAEAWGARVRGFRKCDTCSEMEAAFEARVEASMAPSTGEGDYLPPAKETKTHHYNALGGQRYIDGRGWVNHCKVCQSPEGSGDHFYNKENDPMTQKEGPLTERQITILEHLMAGWTHKEIARKTGISLSTLGQENSNSIRKFKARKITEAVNLYATAIAYQNAGLQLLSSRIPVPVNEAEVHVNHVLEDLANLFQDWSEQRLPK